MDAKASRGWAVILPDGTIDVKTVGSARRFALMNFLATRVRDNFWRDTSDHKIEALWAEAVKTAPGPGLRVAEVSIIEIRG